MARFSSREYFINKKEKAFGDFDVLLSETINITKQVEPKLKELAEMMYSNESVNELLGYDDLELFSVLKGLTIVKVCEIIISFDGKYCVYVGSALAGEDSALLGNDGEQMRY